MFDTGISGGVTGILKLMYVFGTFFWFLSVFLAHYVGESFAIPNSPATTVAVAGANSTPLR